jgi:outer membrane protein assembly factor BamB
VNASVLIDLGDDWSVAEDAPSRRRRPSSRALVAGAGLLALLLPVAAAAPEPAFVQLAAITVQGPVTVESGPAAVFVGEQASGGTATVSRYSVSTGRRTWSTPLADPPESLRYVESAQVLAVSTFEPIPDSSRLTVLDGNTGRQLWSSAGYLLWPWPSDARVERDEPAMLLVGDSSEQRQLRLVQLRTGHPLWSRRIDAGAEVQLAGGAGTGRPDVLVIASDGTATVLAHDTGAVRATKRLSSLSGPGGPNDPTGQTSLSVVGTALIVQHRTDSTTTLFDYDLPSLTERWRRSGSYFGFPNDCGIVLCVGELDRLAALDPRDGTVRWTVDQWQGAGLISGDRLLGYRIGEGQHSGVLDARTGRLLLELDNWSPVATLTESPLVTRPDPTDYRYTWFARLDAGRAVIHPIARLSGLGVQGCHPGGGLLLCKMLGSTLSIWRDPA